MASNLDSSAREAIVANIFNNWELLRRAAATHGSIIANRWGKIGANKRRTPLLSALPSMPISHRSDIAAFQNKAKAQDQQHFLAPAINLEDLVKPRLLPLMIQSRASHPPSAFVDVDFNATSLGWVMDAFELSLQTDDVMLFQGRNSASDYGEIVTKESNPDEYVRATNLGAMTSEYGALALRAQQYIYQFLIDVCRRILHDKDFDQFDRIDDDLVLNFVPLHNDTKDLLDLSKLRLEAPYLVPGNLDLSRLRSIFNAYSDAAKERLVDIVENPGEFASYFQTWKNHRLEFVRDSTGATRYTTRLDAGGLFIQDLLANAMGWAIDNIDRWAAIEMQLNKVSELIHKHAEKIQPSLELPKDLVVAFLVLESLLNSFARNIIGDLRTVFPSSAPLRDFYLRTGRAVNSELEVIIIPRKSLYSDKLRFKLVKAFGLLFDMNAQLSVGLQGILDEIQRLLDGDRQCRNLITSWVGELVSVLGVLAEGLDHIDRFQPWASAFPRCKVLYQEEIQDARDQLPHHTEQLLKKQLWKSLTLIIDLSGDAFEYPEDKKPSKERVDRMRTSEDNLHHFWTSAVEQLESYDALSVLVKSIIQGSEPLRTGLWEEMEHSSKRPGKGTRG